MKVVSIKHTCGHTQKHSMFTYGSVGEVRRAKRKPCDQCVFTAWINAPTNTEITAESNPKVWAILQPNNQSTNQ